jgi:putative transposase
MVKEIPMQIMSVLKNENEQYQGDEVQQRTKQEIEECVTFVRLELYNRDLPCGPEAIRERLETFYHVKSLPSERTIARMLARNGLTHGRTGVYE